MEQTIDVSLNKITQDQGIYPRFHTDVRRIDLFSELLDCETNFPPIRVVRENGYYILLDGVHRLEAYKKTNKKSITAQVWDIPIHHRRLAAARFNNNSSQPLKAEELQKAIRDAYEIDEIKDTAEIAREIGCSDRYVRRILKPLRDKEREAIEERIKKLRDEGVSQRETARKVGMPKTTLHDMETRIKVVGNGTVPHPTTLHKIETSDPTSDEINISETSTEIKENEDVQVVGVEKKVESTIPDIPDSLGDRKLEQWEKNILTTLTLIKLNWDVDRIANQFYRCPEVWVRNSGMVLLALYYNDGECSMDEMKDFLDKIPEEHVEFIDWLLGYPEMIPGRETTLTWLENNRPPYKDVIYDRVLMQEGMFCVRQGKKSLDKDDEEVRTERPLEALPRNIVDEFRREIRFFERLTKMVKQNMFYDKEVRRDLITEYNCLMVAQNTFKDAVQRTY